MTANLTFALSPANPLYSPADVRWVAGGADGALVAATTETGCDGARLAASSLCAIRFGASCSLRLAGAVFRIAPEPIRVTLCALGGGVQCQEHLGHIAVSLAPLRLQRLLHDGQETSVRARPLEHSGDAQRVRSRSREQLTRNDSHRVDVIPHIGLFAGLLLRRHVLDRSRQAPAVVAGEAAGHEDRLGHLRLHLAQPEVRHFDLSAGGQEHVLGFEVAVEDAMFMRMDESPENLAEDGQGLLRWQLAAGLEFLAQRDSMDVLHGHVGRVVERVEVESTHDVLVLEAVDELALAAELLDVLRIGGNLQARSSLRS